MLSTWNEHVSDAASRSSDETSEPSSAHRPARRLGMPRERQRLPVNAAPSAGACIAAPRWLTEGDGPTLAPRNAPSPITTRSLRRNDTPLAGMQPAWNAERRSPETAGAMLGTAQILASGKRRVLAGENAPPATCASTTTGSRPSGTTRCSRSRTTAAPSVAPTRPEAREGGTLTTATNPRRSAACSVRAATSCSVTPKMTLPACVLLRSTWSGQ